MFVLLLWSWKQTATRHHLLPIRAHPITGKYRRKTKTRFRTLKVIYVIRIKKITCSNSILFPRLNPMWIRNLICCTRGYWKSYNPQWIVLFPISERIVPRGELTSKLAEECRNSIFSLLYLEHFYTDSPDESYDLSHAKVPAQHSMDR